MGGNDGMVQVVIVVEEKKNAEKAYFFFEKLFRLDCGRIVFRVFWGGGEESRKITKKNIWAVFYSNFEPGRWAYIHIS